MKDAFKRMAWWPLRIRQFDADGKESEGKATVKITVLKESETRDMQETAIQAMRDSMTAQQLINLPAIGLDGLPLDAELIAARKGEIDKLQALVIERSSKVLDFVRCNVHDWKGLINDDAEVPFSAEVFADLLAYNDFQAACSTALREASGGARAKN